MSPPFKNCYGFLKQFRRHSRDWLRILEPSRENTSTRSLRISVSTVQGLLLTKFSIGLRLCVIPPIKPVFVRVPSSSRFREEGHSGSRSSCQSAPQHTI